MQTYTEATNKIKKYVRERFLRGNKGYYDIITGTSELQTTQLMGILYMYSKTPSSSLVDVCYNDIFKIIKGELGKEWDAYPMTNKEIYKVGESAVVLKDQIAHLNTWRKPAVEPKAGDIEPFMKHLSMALGDTYKVDYILDFLSHRYQNPDIKAPHALYLYGPQGMGKGAFKDVLMGVFGKSAVKYAGKASAVTGVLNWSRTFFIADEIKITKHSEFYNEIKAYTVESEIEDRVLYANYGTHATPAQLILLSNHPPSFLEEGDRRFFVAEWNIGLDKNSDEYSKHFEDYHSWIQSDNGLSALAYFLQHRDLSTYKLRSEPPRTPEKKKALSIVADSAKLQILEMLEDHPEMLAFNEENFRNLRDNNKGWRHLLSECGLTRHDKRISSGRLKKWVWYRDDHIIHCGSGKKATIQSIESGKNMPLESVILDDYDFDSGLEQDF